MGWGELWLRRDASEAVRHLGDWVHRGKCVLLRAYRGVSGRSRLRRCGDRPDRRLFGRACRCRSLSPGSRCEQGGMMRGSIVIVGVVALFASPLVMGCSEDDAQVHHLSTDEVIGALMS